MCNCCCKAPVKPQMTAPRLQADKKCRNAMIRAQYRPNNIPVAYGHDNICTCRFAHNSYKNQKSYSQEQLPEPPIYYSSPTASVSSAKSGSGQSQQLNAIYQGETFVLNNHSYLI